MRGSRPHRQAGGGGGCFDRHCPKAMSPPEWIGLPTVPGQKRLCFAACLFACRLVGLLMSVLLAFCPSCTFAVHLCAILANVTDPVPEPSVFHCVQLHVLRCPGF